MNLICLIKGHKFDDYKCERCGQKRETIAFHKLMDREYREFLAEYMNTSWFGDKELAKKILQDECYLTPQQFVELLETSNSLLTGPGHMTEEMVVREMAHIWGNWLA